MDQDRVDHLTRLINLLGKNIKINQRLLDLVDQAMTHISTGRMNNNERLEFLGDAVLRLAASEYLDLHFPKLAVGACSNLRSQLVSDRWLTKVGVDLQIGDYIKLGKDALKDSSAKDSIYGDATEALIGALYIAHGELETIKSWLTPYWEKTVDQVLAEPHIFNPKTCLQEWSQSKKRGLPSYRTRECNKNHGDPERFYCSVCIGDQELANALGRSRKEAEEKSATKTIDLLIRQGM